MPAIGFTAVDLQRYGRDPSLELRLEATLDGNKTVQETPGSWLGRLVRNIQIAFFDNSAEVRAANTDAKSAVQTSFKEIFGDEIGAYAFRANIGRRDGSGAWSSSSAHPITGRHIAAMLDTAQSQLARTHDVATMQQISIGGMAGPFSKGVCKAATQEWFRRIDAGQLTWRHEVDDLGRVYKLPRDGIDWEAKRARLQAIQDKGVGADPLSQERGRIYRPMGLHKVLTPDGVGLGIGAEFADVLLKDALRHFTDSVDANPFWQLNLTLAQRLRGSVDHAVGLHVTRRPDAETGTAADFTVHVFDSNRREAVGIPGERFGAWLTSHMQERYGESVEAMMLCSVQKERDPDAGRPASRGLQPERSDEDGFEII